MPVTMRSTRSASTGRLRSAWLSERSSLSRSKGSRRPFFFTTTSSRSCTRSKVVKRPPHSGQWRRRRMAELSSEGRLSFTWLSSCPQKGQRIRILSINRETAAEFTHARAHAGLHFGVAVLMVLVSQAVHHFHDQLADLAEFGGTEAAGSTGRRAQPDAGGDKRLLRVVRDGVLVGGDEGAVERFFRRLAGGLFGPEIHQHQ